MKKKILSNLGLKLLSVMIAIVLWFVVVMTNNPKDTKTFYNIPVVLTNVELLENENKVYEVLDNTDMVRVTVEMPRDLMSRMSASDIVAEADVSKLTEINTVPISCYVINEELNVSSVSCNRDSVRLSVEEKAEKWCNVEYSLTGEPAEGFVVDNVTRSPTRIKVSGPKSDVDKISKVVAEVDVTNASSSVTVNVEPVFYDGEDVLIQSDRIVRNEDIVNVQVKILGTKEIPIEVNFTGTPAEGYLATGIVRFEPTSVLVAGTLESLMSASRVIIPAEEVDITGATSDYDVVVNYSKYLPSGTKLLDRNDTKGKAVITVEIEPRAERTIIVPRRNIQIQSVPEGFTAEIDEEAETCSLVLAGLQENIDSVDQNAVTGIVDISEWMKEENIIRLAPGTYEIPISFALADNVTVQQEASILVKVERLEEE